jgi:acetylornithine/N-succinyldiaminopimelate aminotransferase
VTSPLLPTYDRIDLAFERGDGAWLTSTAGERFLDFGGGIAVASLGHGHPHLLRALNRRARKSGTSNLFEIPQAERLARRLVEVSFADYVFFTNSGAEAVEGAIKTARKYQSAVGHPESSASSLSPGLFTDARSRQSPRLAIPNTSRALVPGSRVSTRCPSAISRRRRPRSVRNRRHPDRTDSGRRRDPCPAAISFGAARALRQAWAPLMFDEVQTGIGRTGKLFAYELLVSRRTSWQSPRASAADFRLALLTSRDAARG